MSTLHCALENGADLCVNERQKIQHYIARSTEERRREKNAKLREKNYFALYSDVIHAFDWKSAIEHDGGV